MSSNSNNQQADEQPPAAGVFHASIPLGVMQTLVTAATTASSAIAPQQQAQPAPLQDTRVQFLQDIVLESVPEHMRNQQGFHSVTSLLIPMLIPSIGMTVQEIESMDEIDRQVLRETCTKMLAVMFSGGLPVQVTVDMPTTAATTEGAQETAASDSVDVGVSQGLPFGAGVGTGTGAGAGRLRMTIDSSVMSGFAQCAADRITQLRTEQAAGSTQGSAHSGDEFYE